MYVLKTHSRLELRRVAARYESHALISPGQVHGLPHRRGGQPRPVTASARRVERPGALRPTSEKFSNSARPSPQGVGCHCSTLSTTFMAQAYGAKRDPSRPRRVHRMAPASSRTHPLEDRSLAAIGSTKGGSGVARADRGLAPSLFLSAPLLVPPDSAVEKAPSPPPALGRVVASVHRPSIVIHSSTFM